MLLFCDNKNSGSKKGILVKSNLMKTYLLRVLNILSNAPATFVESRVDSLLLDVLQVQGWESNSVFLWQYFLCIKIAD